MTLPTSPHPTRVYGTSVLSPPMSDHRYDEDDVREILARATEVRTDPRDVVPSTLSDGPSAADRGLTLRELREVAEEVGIPAARIEAAAAALELDRAALPTRGRYWGVELATGHVVRLRRMPTDGEWDRFVVRLRDTFQARGEVASEGSLRTWSNGNLQVLLEPLSQGGRLRFTSRHDASEPRRRRRWRTRPGFASAPCGSPDPPPRLTREPPCTVVSTASWRSNGASRPPADRPQRRPRAAASMASRTRSR